MKNYKFINYREEYKDQITRIFNYYVKNEFAAYASISHQLARYYGLNETSSGISAQTCFYFDNYVFFMRWGNPYSDHLCDYIPHKIHDEIENYLKKSIY